MHLQEAVDVVQTTITPRHLVIQRGSYGQGPQSGSASSSVSLQRGMFASIGAMPGAYASVTATGVHAVTDSRTREKKDMADLNERFASYIEKV